MEANSQTELKQCYDRLVQSVLSIGYDWQTMLAMYGNKQHIEVFNNVSAGFFAMEQMRLQDTCALALARIFDPAETGKNPANSNLTLDTILKLLEQYDATIDAASLRDEARSIKTSIKPIRDMRNKRLAHLDRVTLVGAAIFGPFRTAEYTEALERVEKLLNDIGDKFNQPIMMFDNINIDAIADATKLVNRLMASVDLGNEELKDRVNEYKEKHPDP